MDCSCGWRGPLVATFGEGHTPFVEHYKAEATLSDLRAAMAKLIDDKAS